MTEQTKRKQGAQPGNKNAKRDGSTPRLCRTYAAMKHRCSNPHSSSWRNYGGRGIHVCEEWKNDSEAFYRWAWASGYNETLTLDRIDVNGDYCPENCRWSTWKEQANNRQNTIRAEINGEIHTLTEWADMYGLTHRIVWERYHKAGKRGEDLIAPRRNYYG